MVICMLITLMTDTLITFMVLVILTSIVVSMLKITPICLTIIIIMCTIGHEMEKNIFPNMKMLIESVNESLMLTTYITACFIIHVN